MLTPLKRVVKMSEVVSLEEARKRREEENEPATPHAVGEFVCLGCKHEWVGVTPVPADWVDCPECELPKGTPRFPFACDEDESMLVCGHCNGYALTAFYRAGKFKVLCMTCGNDLTEVFYG